MGAVCPSGWAMTGSSALLQAVNVNVYAAAATTYTLSLSFSWLLFVSDEKPRTTFAVRGHFNHNLFLLISRKTLIAIVFRVGLSGVRNGFPESLGCCVKRRKAIGRHRQVEERDTAGIGILGRRRIGLDLVVRKRAGQVYEQGQILTFCERRIEPVAVQRTLAAPIEVTDSSGRERTGITPIEYADRLVGLACQRDNHVAVRSAVSIGIAAGSVLRPLVVKIVAVYDIVVGNQIIRVSTDLCCGRLANPAPVWSPRLPMMTLIPFAWSGLIYLSGSARIAALLGLL